jgi:centromeric protein E
MQKLKYEISDKKHQIRVLEQRMIGSVEMTPHTTNISDKSQVTMCLVTQVEFFNNNERNWFSLIWNQ